MVPLPRRSAENDGEAGVRTHSGNRACSWAGPYSARWERCAHIRSCPSARLCLKLLVNETPLNVTVNHQGVWKGTAKQRTADRHSISRAISSDCRAEGSPFRPRPVSPDTYTFRWNALDRAVDKAASSYRTAVYSVLPSNSPIPGQTCGDVWGRVADASFFPKPAFEPLRQAGACNYGNALEISLRLAI